MLQTGIDPMQSGMISQHEPMENAIMEAYMYWRTIFRLAWGGSILLIALGMSGARFALGHLPGDIVIPTASAPIHLPVTTTSLISFVAAGVFYFISSFFSRN